MVIPLRWGGEVKTGPQRQKLFFYYLFKIDNNRYVTNTLRRNISIRLNYDFVGKDVVFEQIFLQYIFGKKYGSFSPKKITF